VPAVTRASAEVPSQTFCSSDGVKGLVWFPDYRPSFAKMIDFKGSHYPKDVNLYAVFFYVRYAVSYRDLEEIMAEHGANVDHATLARWVVKYSP
jgi:hypothetical protein